MTNPDAVVRFAVGVVREGIRFRVKWLEFSMMCYSSYFCKIVCFLSLTDACHISNITFKVVSCTVYNYFLCLPFCIKITP